MTDSLDEIMEQGLTEPIDANPMDWQSEHAWQEYSKARDARGAWTKAYDQTQGDWINNPEWIKLRFHEEFALAYYYRNHLAQIAKRTVRRLETDRFRNLRKQYGKASTTIYELRQRIRALQASFSEADRECQCGAWRKARYRSSFEQLQRTNDTLTRRANADRMMAEHWKARFQELKDKEVL